MSNKQPQIRWRKSDTAELERTIKNFNAKLYRLRKNNPDIIDYLPNTIKKSELIESIKTRADFNEIIPSLQRFSERGAEKPIKSSRSAKTTQWELDEFKRKEVKLNKQKEKEQNKLKGKPKTSRGKKTDSTVFGMGDVKDNSLKPTDFNFNSKSQKEWEYQKRMIDSALDPLLSELGKQNYRTNYIVGLRNVGYSEDIVDMVLSIPIDKFIEMTKTDKEAEFDFIYDEIEFRLKEESLREVWEQAQRDVKEDYLKELKSQRKNKRFISALESMDLYEFMNMKNRGDFGRILNDSQLMRSFLDEIDR